MRGRPGPLVAAGAAADTVDSSGAPTISKGAAHMAMRDRKNMQLSEKERASAPGYGRANGSVNGSLAEFSAALRAVSIIRRGQASIRPLL